ncbi:PilZ domain-containing protein [Desulfovibrio sp. JC010]|uniref:PilZ domain-containing protein n=1 Tax=Desulfovibrio sp. JC010 TaxID=2593641 RepID=UPI0013D42D41|nr:PilZ domain-containing protein [Desulfovibrio sp. JC010]NDV25532.1 PilZ domain-containing protein [Desulfovibrio sp. JC010]
MNSDNLSILAYTDSHQPYRNFQNHSKMEIKFCSDLEQFFQEALSHDFSGMILEMKKVMSTPARERNKIFTLAADKPLMRTRINKGAAIFVDDPDRFRDHCTQKKKALIRRNDRVNVDLQSKISHGDDHAMANKFDAEIINLSETGCYLKTDTDLSANQLVNIKICKLANQLPICGGIRWSTIPKDGVYGYGIQFMKAEPDQTAQLYTEFIKPGLKKETAPSA